MNAITDRSTPKDLIFTTADWLFYEQDYQATGVNQIISEAQVCTSFYQHSPSQEALALEYVELITALCLVKQMLG